MGNPYEKSALDAITVSAQSVVADGFLDFEISTILDGCSISHIAGSNTVKLLKRGLYQVSVNADVEPTAAGDMAVLLLNNGTAVPGAIATITGTAGDTYSLTFTALVKIKPSCYAVDNTGNLQVQISAAGSVTNAHIVVAKLA